MSDISNFLDKEGKLKQFPAKRKMKIEALVFLSRKLEVRKEYSEKELNEVINKWHTFADPATLRRELYDYHFINRTSDGSMYTVEENQTQGET